MRAGISITVTPEDRVRLESVVGDRNSPQKHVWRARIILLTADGIVRAVGKDKTAIWRWQERFMQAGVDGLARDKTRPSRIPPLPAETIDRVIALTNADPPHEATHWTAAAMEGRGHQPLLGATHLEGARACPASGAELQALQRSEVRREAEGRRRPLHRSAGPRGRAQRG